MCDLTAFRNEMVEDGYEQDEAGTVPEIDSSYRYGGPQGDDDDAKRKTEERERKKAEVRKRLEEAGRAKKAKKGFLTPERKKKLRKLLMSKAAEDLKQQQLKKDQERSNALQSRIGNLPNVENMENKGELEKVYKQMMERIIKLEAEKYDINYAVRQKDFEINELTIAVNDLRGKFVKPTLKKVSKYDNKFKKMQSQAQGKEETKKADFRSNLKIVKRENVMEAMEKKKVKPEIPEWSKKVKPDQVDDQHMPSKTDEGEAPVEEEAPAEEEEAEDEE